MKLKFAIQQIALCPPNAEAAIKLLSDMGLGNWVTDRVTAHGKVRCVYEPTSVGDLAFNYEALGSARELEILSYASGCNWMDDNPPSVSHIGMHVTEEELFQWRNFFLERNIEVAQELFTDQHTNPEISGKRWYHYVIFNTRPILGVDVKFIVRFDKPPGHPD